MRPACRAFYVHLRDWIIATELDWTESGRVFEHMWPQVTFATPRVTSLQYIVHP